MFFLNKFFGKFSQKGKKKVNKNFGEMTEDEKLREAALFIKANAEGEEGDPEYQFQYGVMFATGQGPHGHGSFTKDINQAIYWLDKSASQGNTDAMCMLGRIYMDNNNPSTAVKYYKMAAEKGNEAACENLAMAYSMGDGIAENKAEAHKWFLKAANLGSPFAQYAAGNNYFNGIGVEENTDEAIKWFWKAAKQGQPNAQFEIGQLYEYGNNDIESARQWYTKAAAQGHKEAQEKLKEM